VGGEAMKVECGGVLIAGLGATALAENAKAAPTKTNVKTTGRSLKGNYQTILSEDRAPNFEVHSRRRVIPLLSNFSHMIITS